MRILVTGATGMLGLEVYRAAVAAGHTVLGLGRTELDITDYDAVQRELSTVEPDVVINCAGLTKHRKPEPTRAEYMAVNAVAPHVLAAECDAIGARMIHVSTDCVFRGDRDPSRPYTEDDQPDAIDDYGASKAAGEVARAPHLTVRCSFVGLGERGLIADLSRNGELASRRWPLWTRAYWSGSTAPAIACALVELAGRPEVTGLMHLAGECVTKADLVQAIWRVGLARNVGAVETSKPRINRWLATQRTDVPVLPPLDVALQELAL